MKAAVGFALLVVAGLWAAACHQPQDTSAPAERPVVAEKPFVAGGSIDIQLDGGGYDVRPATDNHIRVTLTQNAGNAKVEITADGERASVHITDTPHNNFRATIDLPKEANLVIHLSGGELVMGAITGNKDIESNAGNITIAVGDPNDYSSVDASVKAGNIEADAFGGSKSGLLPHFTWAGHGKYTLRADLGAGNLVLRNP